jgi:hypothetical protein
MSQLLALRVDRPDWTQLKKNIHYNQGLSPGLPGWRALKFLLSTYFLFNLIAERSKSRLIRSTVTSRRGEGSTPSNN